MSGRRLVVLLILATACLPGLDLDGRLIGYSFLSAERAEPVADGLLVTLRNGSQRTIDLRYGYLLGTDGHLERPRTLHLYWLCITHDGRRASLVCTSAPLLLLAGGCLLLDAVLLIRLMRRRRPRSENDRDGLFPTAIARETADSVPPKL